MVTLLVPCNGCFLKGASWPSMYHSLITELCHASRMGRPPQFPLSPLLLLCSTVSSAAIYPWLFSLFIAVSWTKLEWKGVDYLPFLQLQSAQACSRRWVLLFWSTFLQSFTLVGTEVYKGLCSPFPTWPLDQSPASCDCRILDSKFSFLFDSVSFSVTGVLNVLQTVEFLLLLNFTWLTQLAL